MRSKVNFLRENDDPALRLPPAYTAERAIAANSVGVLYYVLLSSRRKLNVIATSLVKALLSASIAPWAWYASTRPSTLQLFLAFAKMAVDNLISHYSFFPIFLLLGLLSYVTMRWREWHVNCHIIQAAFHNIGLLVGMSITAEPDEETKALVYDLYRYLNAVHKILYQSVTPHLECLPWPLSAGLLTKERWRCSSPPARHATPCSPGRRRSSTRWSARGRLAMDIASISPSRSSAARARHTATSSYATCPTPGSRRRGSSSTS